MVPRYVELGCSQPDRLAEIVHAEMQKVARATVMPPPPAPAPPPPPPLGHAPIKYYQLRRHLSGRHLTHRQRFGRSLAADFRMAPESLAFAWPRRHSNETRTNAAAV